MAPLSALRLARVPLLPRATRERGCRQRGDSYADVNARRRCRTRSAIDGTLQTLVHLTPTMLDFEVRAAALLGILHGSNLITPEKLFNYFITTLFQ